MTNLKKKTGIFLSLNVFVALGSSSVTVFALLYTFLSWHEWSYKGCLLSDIPGELGRKGKEGKKKADKFKSQFAIMTVNARTPSNEVAFAKLLKRQQPETLKRSSHILYRHRDKVCFSKFKRKELRKKPPWLLWHSSSLWPLSGCLDCYWTWNMT